MKQAKRSILTILIAAAVPAVALADGIEPLARTKISGYKVLTTQISTAAKQTINSAQRSAEAQLASLALLTSSIEQMEVFRDFGPLMGQGPQVCDAINQRSDIMRIADLRTAYEFGRVSSAGRPAIPAKTYMQKRVKQQLDDYCTASQHNAGICRSKFDGMAGLSTDYAGLEIQDQFTAKQMKAANDFVANLVPPPSPEYIGKCGPACENASAMGRQLDTFSSMAALGLSAPFTNKIGAKTYPAIKGYEQ